MAVMGAAMKRRKEMSEFLTGYTLGVAVGCVATLVGIWVGRRT